MVWIVYNEMMNSVPGIIFKQAYGYLLNINAFHLYLRSAAERLIVISRIWFRGGGTQSTSNLKAVQSFFCSVLPCLIFLCSRWRPGTIIMSGLSFPIHRLIQTCWFWYLYKNPCMFNVKYLIIKIYNCMIFILLILFMVKCYY